MVVTLNQLKELYHSVISGEIRLKMCVPSLMVLVSSVMVFSYDKIYVPQVPVAIRMSISMNLMYEL